ncbi:MULTISPECIES: AraC family transcriptional regulator [Chryseobacterium]|uniref:AraC-like DNA-binding protein n=1 Tax=Chryseobacterium geocarposphaerae TaxID=1416776 RepID=A0ABU1LH29_9FLAO|nr:MULTISPECIES: AraC family transcriptional regulator [Chryseobacterium]MDR6406031.1 AraC-like DNA-binding protein [Chryseobacterium geocarposphaerae]MDR6699524.1 AraC-like DNA-binding protein [Chryseobacterium ginsenosidimutans]
MIKKLYFLVFVVIFRLLSCQEVYSDYYKLRLRYENLEENNSKALPLIQPYINKAKKEKNYEKLLQGYKDGVFYSSSNEEKLKYADSAVWAAKLSKNKDLISSAYIEKGVVYYYHYKKYQPALNEYLTAYEYSKNTDNKFLKFQNLYHIGVVKSYLGYYAEASDLFKQCIDYYGQKSKSNLHPNEIFNNKKGYLNSLHQLIICYRNLGKTREADSAIKTGLSEVRNNPDYAQEKGYFLLAKGISDFKKETYPLALDNLNQSLSPIKKAGDFAWLSVDYFYIGKSYLHSKNTKESIVYFKKVDSIFQKHQFILPELRENYEILINHYKKEKDQGQQLYYTGQLLKADSIISKDFTYLAPKIHKEYDTKTLLEEKNKLEKANSWGNFIIIGLIIFALGLIILLIKRYKIQKNIQQKYILLEEKFILQQNPSEKPISTTEEKRTSLDEGKVEELLRKLKIFEDKKEFTQKGLTINKLASQFGTNSNYLSQVINEYKEVNFNKYLSELRINYITNLLFENKEYLKYGIETLAKECGIASRQNFSDLFYEINGIRPTDFIRKRKQELDNKRNFSTLKPI